jgi:crotonobetainyl-CoA:carnitine CoA-transferase CaiB-like acyl-CoA transferase
VEPGPGPLPLSGLRAVTTANALPTAMVGQVLADYGADVYLLEPPSGSALRGHGAWSFWGRGQHSVSVDLTQRSQQERVRSLISNSDVFVDGWGTGVAARLGLDADVLMDANPRLVHARISAFGDDSPFAQLKGWDHVVLAVIGASSGFSSLAQRDGPAFVGTPFCSVGAAHLMLHGLLGALYERERSGCGQQVGATLAQGFLVYDTWNWLLRLLAHRYPGGFDMEPPYDPETLIPYTPFFFRLLVALTKDGKWVQFSQTTDRLWEAFLRACSLDPSDPAVHDADSSEDSAVRVALWESLLAAVRRRTALEWQEIFDADPNVWAEQFRDGAGVLDHPQLVAEGRVVRDAAGVPMPGALAHSSSWPAFTVRPTPALGADNGVLLEPSRAGSAPGAASGEPTLAGVTVLELGTFYAAPYGATLLAEQGARVIKVEPVEGDPIRNLIPYPELAGIKVLQGKESVVLDLATPEGQEILRDLVRSADVVLQSYRAGVAERIHCSAEDLLAINPDLLYVHSPGYGDGGPCGHRPAFAPTIGAASGLAVRSVGGPVAVPAGPDLDLTTAKRTAMKLAAGAMAQANADGFAALGVATSMLLGLVGRARFGGAYVLRCSMLSTMTHALGDSVTVGSGHPTPAPDARLLGLSPFQHLYPTADGWVMLSAEDEADRAALLECCGVGGERGDLEAEIGAAFLAAPAAAWQERLGARGVTCVVVAPRGVDETILLGDLGRTLGFVTTESHPNFGEYPRLAALVRFSRSASVVGPAPLLGQQTEAVLSELKGAYLP